MTEYTRQVRLSGPREEVMRLCTSYFLMLGYVLAESGRPSWMRLRKPASESTGTKDDFEQAHSVTVQFDSITDDETNGIFHFQTIGLSGKGEWNSRSVRHVELLLSNLSDLAARKFREPETRKTRLNVTLEQKPIAERHGFVKTKCRQCGALNDHRARKCESCGSSL